MAFGAGELALMRIAIFAESYPPVVNGAATAVALLAGALRERHEVVVYAPHYPGHKDCDRGVRRFHSFRLPPEPDYPLALPFSPTLFRDFTRARFDVVHTHSPFALGQVGRRWARCSGIPAVTTYHTLYTEYTHYAPWVPAGLGRAGIRWITRQHCNASQMVTVPTEPIRQILQEYGVTRPIEVIPTGVPFPKPLAPDPTFPRAALGIAADAPIVLYAGRLAREKNLGLLFRAFRRVREVEPRAVLLLAGAGPWEAEARRMIEELGMGSGVRFAGLLDPERLACCYAAATVFGFPSLADTQGMVLVEAKAAGLPSVCVDAFGPAIVVRDGVDGLLVADDEALFAAALLRVIREPGLRAALSAAGLADAERFSVTAMASRYEHVYQSVARACVAGPAAPAR
jgi:glycosyltransferase involved in cell wall biosynthesis